MQTSTQLELNRVDTLIISVGTRQVGWRSHNGVVRCFGADGDRGHPGHINELYRELGIDRGFYEDNQRYLWSVRDLGQRYWEHCREWLGDDFSAVELLLDDKIIADCVAKGLKQVILWATDQPETVAWNYRRADTLWLAELMKGKIEATWKGVKVDVLHPVVNANNREAIRQELEGFILPLALEGMKGMPADEAEQFVLVIENKGAVPAIAEGLEICAAALVRQCQVINATPIEPQPLYREVADGNSSACTAQIYDFMPVSEYFWPLERLRVISAWERGDFLEAQLWLKAHQSRHKVLYQLAGYLSLSTNWEIAKFLQDKNFETGWLRSKALNGLATGEEINGWRDRLLFLRKDEFAQGWESVFLIELALRRENYTGAFVQFAQTLERLLYLRCQQEDWLSKGWVRIESDRGSDPSFSQLMYGWLTMENYTKSDNFWQLFTAIRVRRNDIIHKAEAVTLGQLRSLWADKGFPVKINSDSGEILKLMMDLLKGVCRSSWKIPNKTLLRSLYDWGLKVLSDESAKS
ncbi:hypothetical protein [Argonema galeatum]|uniref:hypothetical protein n=1 Tax=Argonema galeatum TaxID=2942762 RepID=UPI002011DE2E|nr:hypothetical protein [Argonema galeatum]MCL1463255.1 hypothetical protein [Argonema galeatum A003/A1]